jgi:hypothetical protein
MIYQIPSDPLPSLVSKRLLLGCLAKVRSFFPSFNPLTFAETLQSPQGQHWMDAKKVEVEKLQKLDVWDVINTSAIPPSF